jgi:hypothetical protein
MFYVRRWDIPVRMATSFGLEDMEFESQQGWQVISSPKFQTGSETRTASYKIGTTVLPGDKEAGEWRW